MPQNKYASSADEIAAQKAAQGQDLLAQFLRQGIQGKQQQANIQAQSQADINKEAAIQQQNKDLYDFLRAKQPHGKISVSPGGGMSTDDEEYQRLRFGQGLIDKQGNEARKLNDTYTKATGDYANGFASVNGIFNGLDQKTAQGDKIAATNAARIAEGKGQRLFQGLVQSFGLDPNLYKSAQDIENYFSSNPQSRLSDGARQAMYQVGIDHYNSLVPQYQAAKDEFTNKAQYQAPIMSQAGQLPGYLSQMGTSTDKLMGSIGDRVKGYQTQQQAPQQAPAAQAANTAWGALGKFFGLSGAPSSQAQQYDPDVTAYAQKHKISPADAFKIKQQRTMGRSN